jgi:DEAD/DEAH box helicase domain-containing protein
MRALLAGEASAQDDAFQTLYHKCARGLFPLPFHPWYNHREQAMSAVPIIEQKVTAMRIAQFLQEVKAQRSYQDQVAHVQHIARRAWYGQLDRALPRQVQVACKRLGIERFYIHQAEAINAIRRGEHVVVSTSTASGKTLIYNLPVIERCLLDWRARALYLFPTKALAQDQVRALGELLQGELDRIRVGVYDGDTPRSARGAIRRRAAILLTNPDMLHVGILPNHHLWSTFFKNLRYVVVDEAHVYRGVFGSQVGCVLRRLRRVCAAYGNRPQFIACSATMANPAQHLETLTGVRPQEIDEDGSPQGERTFVLWNPPLVDPANGIRRSANTEAANLFTSLTRRGLRNLVFARTRRVAELILRYTQESLRNSAPELLPRVAAYRAGYMPQERRALEQALFSGSLTGVTTTSALELGIDIGDLDATVSVGYPGTIASLWQQAGRAGRGEGEALNILIGLDNPLDQYFMHHPRDLFERPHEAARCDPSNLYILSQHLPCAAYEVPLTQEDQDLFGALPGSPSTATFVDAMIHLEESGQLDYRNDRWFYAQRNYPSQDVNLRSASSARVALVDTAHGNQVLEEIDAATATFRAHPGAIYLHQGAGYQVTDLDLGSGIAAVKPVETDYYTQPREINEVHIVRSVRHRQLRSCTAFYGRVRVTSQVIGFSRKRQFSDEVLSQEPLDLPPQTFETMAVWWDVPLRLGQQITQDGGNFAGGLHAVEHACIGMLPLLAMCDRLDLGGISTPRHIDTESPLVCVYDAYPGGVGLSERGFETLEPWWQATLEAIRTCPCQAGCPSCIHSPKCGNNNEPLDKAASLSILAGLLGREST